jgi:hypothetical protein
MGNDLSGFQRYVTGTHDHGRNEPSHLIVLHELRKEQREQLATIQFEHNILHGHGVLPHWLWQPWDYVK